MRSDPCGPPYLDMYALQRFSTLLKDERFTKTE